MTAPNPPHPTLGKDSRGVSRFRSMAEEINRLVHEKFDVTKLDRLNDPARFDQTRPESLWAALGNPTPRTIVDIGAGTGLFAARFAEMAPEALVYAVDNERAMIDWMRKHRLPALEGRLIAVLSEEETIPLDAEIADLVVMLNLHHELAVPEKTYSEAARLAKPGGQLLVVDWAPGGGERGPSQAVRATAEELVAAVVAAGFVRAIAHDVLPQHSLITADKL